MPTTLRACTKLQEDTSPPRRGPPDMHVCIGEDGIRDEEAPANGI